MSRIPLALAAAATGVPERTLRRWAADGRLTVDRAGASWLVDPMEVDELAERRAGQGGRLTKCR